MSVQVPQGPERTSNPLELELQEAVWEPNSSLCKSSMYS